MNTISELLKLPGTVIVDVRTPAEYMGGHVTGSINIPLNEIPMRMEELRAMKNIILCCASGGRSMNATMFLKQNGIECCNGGAWTDVNYYSNNN
jgi:phage shock protein E